MAAGLVALIQAGHTPMDMVDLMAEDLGLITAVIGMHLMATIDILATWPHEIKVSTCFMNTLVLLQLRSLHRMILTLDVLLCLTLAYHLRLLRLK